MHVHARAPPLTHAVYTRDDDDDDTNGQRYQAKQLCICVCFKHTCKRVFTFHERGCHVGHACFQLAALVMDRSNQRVFVRIRSPTPTTSTKNGRRPCWNASRLLTPFRSIKNSCIRCLYGNSVRSSRELLSEARLQSATSAVCIPSCLIAKTGSLLTLIRCKPTFQHGW